MFNPASHFIATANHNILPAGYKIPLGFEWTQPFRIRRIMEMFSDPAQKFSVADFERMQQDVISLPAKRFQGVLRRWGSDAPAVRTMLRSLAMALAPLLFGAVSDHVFGGGRSGLEWTFIIMIVPLGASSWLLFKGLRTYPADD